MNYRKQITTIHYCLVAIAILFFTSCNERPKQKQIEINENKLKEDIIKVNKPVVVLEQDEINAYVKSHGYKMQTTGTGLRFMLLKENKKGKKIEAKDVVTVNYKVWLLDGTLCYSSDKKGAKTFAVGADNVETGVHEGVKLMRQGEKALMILPSHLAFNLIGDRDKIPPKASVVYEIEVMEVK
ncbi:MAG: FKBP-type peptidyl-prolyl cis-trans isomerase [Bacteroidia bacterium]